jgi:large subunit ribosomal protein L18
MATDKVLSRLKIKKEGKGQRFLEAPEKPRLSVYRSNNEIYAQLIDDTTGKTHPYHIHLKYRKIQG